MGLSRCRLNRTTSKRWENTTVPAQGTAVLVSGYLSGDGPRGMFVEVETMHFVAPTTRSAEGTGSSQTPGKSKFGIPTGFVCWLYDVFFSDNASVG
jgi:hypothetical protein